MKRNLIYFLSLALIVVALYALLQKKEDGEQEKPKTVEPPKKIDEAREAEELVKIPDLTEEQKKVLGGRDKADWRDIAEENKDLTEKLFEAIEEEDGDKFKLALWRFITRYKADPFPVYEKLIPLLNHPNKGIRHALAEKFIVIGYEREKAVTTLIELLNDESIKPIELQYPAELGGEKYKRDRRKEAAELLTKYRVEEARDAIWNAYQQTKNSSYFQNLFTFRDERILGVVQEDIEKKGNYHEHYKVLGMFKVKEAEKPLEELYEKAQKPHPFTGRMGDRKGLAWALYQITGEQQYYDFLMEKEFYMRNTFFEVPNILEILENKLRSDDGRTPNAQGRDAFHSLLARGEEGRKIIEDYLVEVFDKKIKSPLSVSMEHRVAASLNTEKLNAAAQRYEDKYTRQSWIYYKYQKGWPINGLISSYAY